MEFARKILQNYGWKEGEGLGKNKNGIAKPLKAALKFDNAGFGADQAAEDFNNHWWERVFNEAATNVNVSREGEKIKMSLKDDNSVEISTKAYSMRKLKKLKQYRKESSAKNGYENFLQAATLINLGDEVENPDKIGAHDIEVSRVNILTDEELFKACGGRTAHKGARHGLKLSGKLLRIEQQEAELLATMMAKQKNFTDKNVVTKKTVDSRKDCFNQSVKEVIKEKLKKNKRKRSKEKTNETCSEPAFIKSKKKKVCSNKAVISKSDEVEAVNVNPFLRDKETNSLKKRNTEKKMSEDKISHKKKKKNK